MESGEFENGNDNFSRLIMGIFMYVFVYMSMNRI